MTSEPESDGPYERRVLVYFDILGWKDVIEKSAKKDASALIAVANATRLLAHVEQTIKGIRDRITKNASHASEVAVFSDSVVMSCGPNPVAIFDLVAMLQLFCVALMEEGLNTRGAIVQGLLHHKDNIIYGPALNEAYGLESKVAKYPRIIVGASVRPDLLAMETAHGGISPLNIVEEDQDGLHILNPFGGTWRHLGQARPVAQKVRERVVEELGKNPTDVGIKATGIRANLGWLRNFVERVLKQLDEHDEALQREHDRTQLDRLAEMKKSPPDR